MNILKKLQNIKTLTMTLKFKGRIWFWYKYEKNKSAGLSGNGTLS